jgi:hypothetical protein
MLKSAALRVKIMPKKKEKKKKKRKEKYMPKNNHHKTSNIIQRRIQFIQSYNSAYMYTITGTKFC